MDWPLFHHPDFCATVVRRRAAVEVLLLLEGLAALVLSRGRSLIWQWQDSQYVSYQCAMNRLRKAGLIIYSRGGGRAPVMRLEPKGEERLPDELRPERFWNQRWNGIWYVLAYDVPETEKSYREQLRRFLRRNRMGGLQGSVWISPRDIRPVFSDLAEAIGLGAYAQLLEARTVLGQDPLILVDRAWNMDRLDEAQAWYIDQAAVAAERIASGALSRQEVLNLANASVSAYLSVMEKDPLLPRDLLPAHYRGPDTLAALRSLQQTLAESL